MQPNSLIWALQAIHLPEATKMAESLATAARIRASNPLTFFNDYELDQPVGDGRYTRRQSLIGGIEASKTSNRKALARDFDALAPKLIRLGYDKVRRQLYQQLAEYGVDQPRLRRTITVVEKASVAPLPLDQLTYEEQGLWRVYCAKGVKGINAITEPVEIKRKKSRKAA